jgi:hypothetical protein
MARVQINEDAFLFYISIWNRLTKIIINKSILSDKKTDYFYNEIKKKGQKINLQI